MNFEKHSDPKASLNIGKIAVPIKIFSMYTNDPDEQREGGGYGFADMSDKDCRRILESISGGELDPGWEDRYFVGNPIKESHEPGKGKSTTFHILTMKQCINNYVEFQDKKYLIPEP